MPFSVGTRFDSKYVSSRKDVEPVLDARPQPQKRLPGAIGGLAAGLWWLLFGATGVGCASKACEGDTCPAICSDDSCSAGARCVNGLCRPECKNDSACLGGDTCRRLRTDYGSEGNYCYGASLASNPYQTAGQPGASSPGASKPGTGNPASEPCKKNVDCKGAATQACVQGMCLTLCETHLHCGTAGSCTGTVKDDEGNPAHYCVPDTFPRAAGQYGTSCFQNSSTCDTSQGFFCLGAEGQTDSVCTQSGCNTDDNCPTGFFCSSERSGRPTCEATCGAELQSLDENCVPAADIGPGRPYRCSAGVPGLQFAACLPRAFCNNCETDADCGALPNQICAKGPDGQKICTQRCTPGNSNCPWGGATDCKVYDPELGQATCGHRFGKCEGSGHGCEPCVDDRTCPNGFCATSTYSGEHFCVDLKTPCSCKSGDTSCAGGGCEASPSGLEQQCLARSESEDPSVCYGALTRPEVRSSPLGCWLAPK
jgi:hypothetical protein